MACCTAGGRRSAPRSGRPRHAAGTPDPDPGRSGRSGSVAGEAAPTRLPPGAETWSAVVVVVAVVVAGRLVVVAGVTPAGVAGWGPGAHDGSDGHSRHVWPRPQPPPPMI